MPEVFELIGPKDNVLVLSIITTIGLIVSVVMIVLARRMKKKSSYDIIYDYGMPIRGSTYALTALFVLMSTVALVPYHPKYWNEYRVEGTVVSVTNMFDEGSGSVSNIQVVELDTMEHPIISDGDLRFITKVGEEVRLTCNINWIFRTEDTYRCRLAN